MSNNRRMGSGSTTAARGLIAALIVASWCAAAHADVKIDLLEGWGAFGSYGVTEWECHYNRPSFDTPDYDFDSNSLYFTKITDGQFSYRTGVTASSADDRVAVGWRRVTGSTVNPGRNIAYRLSPAGIDGSNCQYLALKGLEPGVSGEVCLESVRILFTKLHASLSPGDEVTFRVDHIRMTDYSGLTGYGGYTLWIQWDTGAAKRTLTPSDVPFADEVVATIPSSAAFVSAKIVIEGQVEQGKEPGIYVDGAHLYIRHPGSTTQETRESSLPRNRSIKTFAVRKNPTFEDALSQAANYDCIITGIPQDYAWAAQLKALSPGIKLFVYQNSRAHKDGDKDPYFAYCPMGYYYLSAQHPEWLIERTPGVPGDYAFSPDFPWEYWTKLANAAFEAAWADKAKARIAAAGHNGVLVDNLNVSNLQTDAEGKLVRPRIEAWEVQKFLRSITTAFASAGLETMGNACGFSLDSGLGSAVFDPFWTPQGSYTGPEYTPNSPANTPIHILQEWSFVRPLGYNRLDYNKEFWKTCIDNMDAVKRWNTAVGDKQLQPNQRRWLYVFEDIYAESYDAAFGPDGWRHFGLCSYLLAQNDWTLFGWGVMHISDIPPLDLSVTTNLGAPIGDHISYGGDVYFRYRRYGPSVGGAAGGVVVVNANPDASRTFTLDFDGVDEQGEPVSSGQQVVINPRTGRIFIERKGPVFVRIRTPSDSVAPDEIITVTVDYLSSSSESALDVVVRATVPAQMTYVPGSAEISGGSYNAADNTVTWKIGTVVAGQSGRRTFKAKVK